MYFHCYLEFFSRKKEVIVIVAGIWKIILKVEQSRLAVFRDTKLAVLWSLSISGFNVFFLFPYFWTISNITFGIVSKRETKNERRASIWIEYDPSFIKIELRFASCCGRALIPFEYVIKRGSHETNCKTAFRIKLHLNHYESNTEFGTMMMRNAMQMYKSVPIIYHLLTKKSTNAWES